MDMTVNLKRRRDSRDSLTEEGEEKHPPKKKHHKNITNTLPTST